MVLIEAFSFIFFFSGNGQLIRPGDLTLGGCAALHVDDHILQFQTDLQGCNSTMKARHAVPSRALASVFFSFLKTPITAYFFYFKLR